MAIVPQLGVLITHPERLEKGGLCLIVETEVNRDSKRTNESGPSWLVRWACRAGSALAALVAQ